MAKKKNAEYTLESYCIKEEPFYVPTGNEVDIFKIAYKKQLPVMLVGPTGCGKNRFIDYMAWELGKDVTKVAGKKKAATKAKHKTNPSEGKPLVKVSCHEDLSADDLLGRYLLDGSYVEGSGLSAFRNGSILYLEEFVESRKDVQVMVHPLADKPRILTVEKLGRIFEAHPEFMLVLSYNPGYQTIGKEPKPSTRQRFITIDFDYAKPEDEAKIIRQESGLDLENAMYLVQAANKIRNLKGKDQGLDEGASTRLLINAGHLITDGIPPKDAIKVAVINSLTYNPDTKRGIEEIITSIFP